MQKQSQLKIFIGFFLDAHVVSQMYRQYEDQNSYSAQEFHHHYSR